MLKSDGIKELPQGYKYFSEKYVINIKGKHNIIAHTFVYTQHNVNKLKGWFLSNCNMTVIEYMKEPIGSTLTIPPIVKYLTCKYRY